MKLGFVFDTKFTKYNNNYYSINLSSKVLENRYLNKFDSMVVIGRSVEITNSPEGRLLQSNSDKISFDCIDNEPPHKRVLHFKKDSRSIMKAIKQCDAVICRGWRGTLACRKLKKNYMVEVVNCAWDSYWNHGFIGKIVAPIMFLLRRVTTKNAPYVLYVTKEFLQRRYPTTGKSVAVSDVKLTYADTFNIDLRLQKINNKKVEEKIVIGTAAAVDVPFKGQRFVIDSLARLKKRGIENVEYQIAGSGDISKLLRRAERKGVVDKVVFRGNILHDEIFEWYDNLDIYIQPSLQEGLPRALIEAMSRGLLCFGTKTGGIPELLSSECICKNNFILRKKFAKFISMYTKEFASKQALYNYNKSKNYEGSLLEAKRDAFFMAFYESTVEGRHD